MTFSFGLPTRLTRAAATGLGTAAVVLATGTLAAPAALAAPAPGAAGAAFGAAAEDPYARVVLGTGLGWNAVTVDLGGAPRPAGLAVHVRVPGSDTRLATVTEFPFGGKTVAGKVQPLQSAALKLAELGNYALDLEYRDARGVPVLRKDLGRLTYQVRPWLSEVGPVGGSVSLDSLRTAVRGRLTATDPRDGQEVPLGGTAVKVDFTGDALPAEPVTTGADGRFLLPHAFAGTETSTEFTVSYRSAPAEQTVSASGKVWSSNRYPEIRLDSPAELTARHGSTAKVTGKVVRKAWTGADEPELVTVPGISVLVSTGYCPVAGCAPKQRLQVVKTDAKGRFSLSRKVLEDGTWMVGFDPALPANPWVYPDPVAKRIEVTATARTAFEDYRARQRSDGKVTVSGRLALYEGPAVPPGSAKVKVQFSANGRTGWTTVSSFGTPYGKAFTHTVPGRGAGYWRLKYTGTTTGDEPIPGTVSAKLPLGAVRGA
ncbi:hypothetical protein [Streptomyces sp. NPDC101132]|uniref:hypothetical protein n=1 Tax=Streptomyces sp. NPDC101132 TaxID=3366110 RepID=UPI00382F74D9